jgi:hypothetical protein
LVFPIDTSLGETITITASPSLLQNVTITTSGDKILTGADDTYTFDLVLTSPIPDNGYIVIILPS